VVGVDISLATLKNFASEMKPYNTGYIFIMSDNGEIVYHPEAKFLRQNYRDVYADLVKKDGIADKIARGEEFTVLQKGRDTIGDLQITCIPVHIGSSPKPWYMGIVVPESAVNSSEAKLIEISVIISLIALVAMVLVVDTDREVFFKSRYWAYRKRLRMSPKAKGT